MDLSTQSDPSFSSDEEEAGASVENPSASPASGSSDNKRKRSGKSRRRRNQRGGFTTLFHRGASFAAGVWGGLVRRVVEEQWGTTYQRRCKLMVIDFDQATHRGCDELEAGAVWCKPNAATILHVPPPQTALRVQSGEVTEQQRTELYKGQPVVAVAVFICTRGPGPSNHRPLDRAINRCRTLLCELDHRRLRAAWVQGVIRLNDTQIRDLVRGHFRLGAGWAELACASYRLCNGVPQERGAARMWWPRISASHSRGSPALLALWLPLMSAALEVATELPIGPGGARCVVEDLQATVGCLVFPYEVELVGDAGQPWDDNAPDGRPRLRAIKPENRLACSCMQRCSFLLAQGAEAAEETVADCCNLPDGVVRYHINEHGKTLVHIDPRDAGIRAQLLGADAAVAAGVEVVRCARGQRHQPAALAAQPDFFQLVVVIYHGCSEAEALAVVGLSEDELSAIFYAPRQDEGVCMAIYLLDFSARYHGNPVPAGALPPKAWALRATPYATVHGATWARRIARMEPRRAALYLRSLAGLEGAVPLNCLEREAKQAGSSSSEPVESTPPSEDTSQSSAAADLEGQMVKMALPKDDPIGSHILGLVTGTGSGKDRRYWVEALAGGHWRRLDPSLAEEASPPPRRGRRA